MPRPKSKLELLVACEERYKQLNAILNRLTPPHRHACFPFEHRDKNVRDVLVHLHAWHLLLLAWYETGMAGKQPEMPAAGYSWKTTPELNLDIWKRNQKTSLSSACKMLDDSHRQLRELIDRHTQEELFEKGRYAWTGTTSLGSYLTSATSSHYAWACKLLQKYSRLIAKVDV